jgi:DNA-binding GntR family transcriptional regulator
MTLQSPLRRPIPLRDQVHDALRDSLRRGLYRPGERLTEMAAADTLGVSRTPVREALGLLAREGLLVALPGGGFQVPSIDSADIEEVFEIRELIEPHAAAQSARAPTRQGLAGMRAAVATELAHFEDKTADAFSAANSAFRDHLFGMCGNGRLARLIGTFEDHVQYVRWVTLEDRRVRDVVIQGQQEMIAAVEARDAAAAETAMRRHLASARRALMASLGKCAPAAVAAK